MDRRLLSFLHRSHDRPRAPGGRTGGAEAVAADGSGTGAVLSAQRPALAPRSLAIERQQARESEFCMTDYIALHAKATSDEYEFSVVSMQIGASGGQ